MSFHFNCRPQVVNTSNNDKVSFEEALMMLDDDASDTSSVDSVQNQDESGIAWNETTLSIVDESHVPTSPSVNTFELPEGNKTPSVVTSL